MTESKVEVFKYISERLNCTDCKYSEFCPSMKDGVLMNDCIIRRDYRQKFDTFYNLYFGEFQGLKNEMLDVAYGLKEECITQEDKLQYFTSLTKIMGTFYSPEKQSKEDTITDVIVNIEKL